MDILKCCNSDSDRLRYGQLQYFNILPRWKIVVSCAVHRITARFRVRPSALHCCRSRKLLAGIRHARANRHVCRSYRVSHLHTVYYFGGTNVAVSSLGGFFICRSGRPRRVSRVLSLLRSHHRSLSRRHQTLGRTTVRIRHGLRCCNSVGHTVSTNRS